MTAPLPGPLRALTASLRGAREPELRVRLQVAIAGVKKLYGLPAAKRYDDTGDLRKRRTRTTRCHLPGRSTWN